MPDANEWQGIDDPANPGLAPSEAPKGVMTRWGPVMVKRLGSLKSLRSLKSP